MLTVLYTYTSYFTYTEENRPFKFNNAQVTDVLDF